MPESPLIPIGGVKYLCIEYPGYIKSTERAIKTLGGVRAINDSLSNDKPFELRYRPDDVFSHPIIGDNLPSSKLVVKVTRRVKKNSEGEIIEQDPNFQTEILGTAFKTVRFRGLADFQYLLPKHNETRQLKEALMVGDVEKLVNYKIADDDEDLNNLRSIPPPLFSPLETPFSYNYRQNSSVIRVRVRQPDGSFKVKLINRSSRPGLEVTTIYFEDENYPTKSWHNLKAMTSQEELETIELVGKLFEERPLWTKHAALSVLDPKYHKHLRGAFPRHAYVMISGPWREIWVKYGIDPRKDNKYNIYQQLDIRRNFRGIIGDGSKPIHARRSKTSLVDSSKEGGTSQIEYKKNGHLFDGVNLKSTYSFYQICDIIDPDITPLINDPRYLKQTPSKTSGFYYHCVFNRIREAVRRKAGSLSEGKTPERIEDIELGLDAEIKKEIENSKNKQDEEEERMEEEEEEESGSVSTTDVERVAKEAYAEISSNSKRLKDVVDEYMTELENVESNMAKEYEDEMDILEEYEENIDEEDEIIKEETVE